METITIITVYLPRPDGPPRVQDEIYCVRALTDSGALRVHYQTLEGNSCTLMVSGNMYVKIETCDKAG